MLKSALIPALALGIVLMAVPATGRSGVASEDRWNPQHIDSLPPEIRSAIAHYSHECGGPLAAEHMFATYFQKGPVRLIALHFEHLRCGDKVPVCSPKGCLHQIYISAGGIYRLMKSSNVPEVDLTQTLPDRRR